MEGLSYLLYPSLELGLNAYVQYKHYSQYNWLFPLYPFNDYKLKERVQYFVNFVILTASTGYILDHGVYPPLSFITNMQNFALLILMQSAIAYYGHRYAHKNKFIFNYSHCAHHNYVDVKPFIGFSAFPIDIMFFVLLFLLLPFYTFQLSKMFYILFVSYVIGSAIVDHAGVEIKMLGYNSNDHRVHHIQMNKNYGFPLSIFDKLHNTYLSYDDLEAK